MVEPEKAFPPHCAYRFPGAPLDGAAGDEVETVVLFPGALTKVALAAMHDGVAVSVTTSTMLVVTVIALVTICETTCVTTCVTTTMLPPGEPSVPVVAGKEVMSVVELVRIGVVVELENTELIVSVEDVEFRMGVLDSAVDDVALELEGAAVLVAIVDGVASSKEVFASAVEGAMLLLDADSIGPITVVAEETPEALEMTAEVDGISTDDMAEDIVAGKEAETTTTKLLCDVVAATADVLAAVVALGAILLDEPDDADPEPIAVVMSPDSMYTPST